MMHGAHGHALAVQPSNQPRVLVHVVGQELHVALVFSWRPSLRLFPFVLALLVGCPSKCATLVRARVSSARQQHDALLLACRCLATVKGVFSSTRRTQKEHPHPDYFRTVVVNVVQVRGSVFWCRLLSMIDVRVVVVCTVPIAVVGAVELIVS